jgi:tRNA(adenine34) deaminase
MNEVSIERHRMFMRRAIEIARNAPKSQGAAPIGCVIVRDGRVIGEGSNEVGPQCDPTAHAEIVSIRRASTSIGEPDLSGATLYSTLQPCGMCTMASIWSKVGRIVFGAGRHQVHAMYFEDRHFDMMDFIKDAFRDDLDVIPAVLSKECAAIYWKPDDNPPA